MKKFLALVLACLLTASLAGCAAPVEEADSGPTQEQMDAIRKTAEDIVLPFAELYGINDLEYVDTALDDYYGVCTFSSEQFRDLPWEEQLGLLTDPVLSVYDQKPFPEDSPIADKGFDLEIVSGEERYTDFTVKGQSELRINGKTYGEMTTLYSLAVAQSLAETMARVEDRLSQSADEALLEIELRRKLQDDTLCPVCGGQYREGSSPSKMIREYGYCRSLCRSRLEELMQEAG